MPEKKIKTTLQYKEDFLPEGLSSNEIIRKKYLDNKTVYNKDGNVIRAEKHNPDGGLEEYEENKYDDNGLLVEAKTVMNGEIADHTTYEIVDGKTVKAFIHYLDGTHDTINYEYDDNRLVRKTFYDEDGEMEKEVIFQTSDSHSAEVTKDEEGAVVEEKEKLYSNGRVVKEKYHDAFSGIRFGVEYEYDEEGRERNTRRFDDQGNVVENLDKAYDNKGRLISIDDSSNEKRITFAYDEQGRLILQEEKLYDGTVISSIKRTYNADNLHDTSEVYINGFDRQMSQHYNVYHEYEFFEE